MFRLIEMVTLVSLQSTGLDTSFQNRDIEDLSNRLQLDSLKIMMRAASGPNELINLEIKRQGAYFVSFNLLVEYCQKKKPSCLTEKINSVYSFTSSSQPTDQLRTCLLYTSNIAELIIVR